MSEVKRYDCGTEYDGGVMNNSPTGEYVEFDDYAALKAKCDQLAAESEALKEAVALLLEDARRVQQLEPNAGTETRINTALSLLTRAGKDGE